MDWWMDGSTKEIKRKKRINFTTPQQQLVASGIEVTIGTGLLWLVGSPIIPIPTSVVTNGYESSFTSIKRVLSKSLSCVLKWDAETLKLALCRFQGQNEGLWKISNTIILEIPWFCKSFVMGYINGLTHWGRVTHICVSDLTSIGSDNGLSPGRRHAIIRTNAGILLIRPVGTNFSESLVKILIFSFKKMRLRVSSAKRRPFCLGLNELMQDCSISSALSIEIVQSYTKPSISSGSHCWSCYLWPILLTWFNFNPSMDK